jgi:hypothetical protein
MKNYVNIKGQIEETLSAKFMSLKKIEKYFQICFREDFLDFLFLFTDLSSFYSDFYNYFYA